jgi:hypothetical protein
MTAFSDHLENELLDHLMGNSYTAPTGLWLALYTTDPGDLMTGTEVAGNGYVRQSIQGSMAFQASGIIENTSDVSFTAAGGAWGTISHAAVWETQGAEGSGLWHEALTASKTVNDTDTLTFSSGDITLSLN